MRTKLIFLTATLAAMFILISTASAQKVGGYKQSSKDRCRCTGRGRVCSRCPGGEKELTIELVAVEKAKLRSSPDQLSSLPQDHNLRSR
jgi:hypothetical protein